MQIVGYMILLVFYLCYFIKMFQQRKQGIQTDHMGKGKQGIQKKIEIMMKGATIAFRNHRRYCFYCFCFNNER